MNNVSATPGYNQTSIEILWEAFKRSIEDLIDLMPSILVILAIVAIYTLIAIILTRLIRSLLIFLRVDDLLKPIFKRAFSITNLIIILIDLGIALLAVYTIVTIIFPREIGTVTTVIEYMARIASVAFLIIFLFITLDAVIERIKMEPRMRGFMFLMIFFITLVLIVDVTALSEEVKTALSWGISMGLGLAIGVFALWYFFHEIFEETLKKEKETK